MLTNQILATLSLSMLGLCIVLAVIVLVGKPKGKVLGLLAGLALACMVFVTMISGYLSLIGS